MSTPRPPPAAPGAQHRRRPRCETTPARAWTGTSGSSIGGGRTAAEQTLAFTPVASVGLTGTHTLTASGQALDDPNHSTTAGTQLCMDDNGGFTTTGD